MSQKRSESPEGESPRNKRANNRQHVKDLKAQATQKAIRTQKPIETEEPQTSKVNSPPRTEEESDASSDKMMEQVEQILLDLSKNHIELAKEEAKIMDLKDEEKVLEARHDKKIKGIQDRMTRTNIPQTMFVDLSHQVDQENASFENAINELNEEKRKRRKTSDAINKTLEDKEQEARTYIKVVKHELNLWRERSQAKPLGYFMSKIKDPEALLSEVEKDRHSTKSLFGFEATPEESKRIMKRLGDYTYTCDRDSIPSACSVSFQLPLLTVNNDNDNSNYVQPSGSVSKRYKNTEMEFVPKEMKEEEINAAFENPNIKLLDIISSLFGNIPQPEQNMNKLESSSITSHILFHLAELLSVIKRTPITVKPQAPIGSGVKQTEDVIPDFSIFSRKVVSVRDDHRFCVAESKRFPYITEEMWKDSDLLKKEINGDLHSSFKQLVISLVEAKCSRGLVCDWKKAILVEIDLEKLSKIMKNRESGPAKIPIYFKVIDIYDIRPSYLQVLFAFLKTAFDKEKEDKKVFDSLDVKSYLGLSPSSGTLHQKPGCRGPGSGSFGGGTSLGSPPGGCSSAPAEAKNHVAHIILTNSQFKPIRAHAKSFQIFSTEAENLGSVIREPFHPEDEIVMKVFSTDAWEDGEEDSRKDYVDECYQWERKFIDKLMKDPEFNNCFLEHEEFEVTIKDTEGNECSGKCILSHKINSDTPRDKETLKKAKQQLDVIHRNGIYHNDVALRNILWSGDKIYFIDFSYSYANVSKNEKEMDNMFLTNSFPS